MTKQELFKAMEDIVNETVTAYKSDLEHDKQEITDHEPDSIFEGIWLVRDCGTFLPRISNALDQAGFIDAIYNNMRVLKQYYITKDSAGVWDITEIGRADVDGIIGTPTQSGYIFKFAYGGTWDYAKTMTGHFESLKKAQDVAEDIKQRKGYKMAYVERA